MANISFINSCRSLNIKEACLHLPKQNLHYQEHDLLSFALGSWEVDKHNIHYILQAASTTAPLYMATFAEKKSKVSQLGRHHCFVQKCLQRRLQWSKQTGLPVETFCEQYIEPNDGVPVKVSVLLSSLELQVQSH